MIFQLPCRDSIVFIYSTIIPRAHGCPHCVKDVQKNRYQIEYMWCFSWPLPSGSFCLYAGKAEQKECICLSNEPKQSDNSLKRLTRHEAVRDWGRDYFRATFPAQSLAIKWRINMKFRSFSGQDCKASILTNIATTAKDN